MTKKKKAQVIKLDKSTIKTSNLSAIYAHNKIIQDCITTNIQQIRKISNDIHALNYSGHKYLSDVVIRLQRNANSAVMVTDILLDILKCMANEECYIIQQLNNEAAEIEKAQQEILKRNGKQ